MLVSSPTLVLNRVLLLWTMAFFLLKDPYTVYASVPVVVLSQSAGLPNVYVQPGTNTVGLLAVALGITGLEDFVGLFAQNPLDRLGAVVPVRLFAYFILTALAYLHVGSLGNAVVFTYGFVEVVLNFWLYTAVREERNEKSRLAIRGERGQDQEGQVPGRGLDAPEGLNGPGAGTL